jgi:hypothetical protein
MFTNLIDFWFNLINLSVTKLIRFLLLLWLIFFKCSLFVNDIYLSVLITRVLIGLRFLAFFTNFISIFWLILQGLK